MSQRPKPEIRDAIARAALDVFAEAGYVGATIGAIAERAGVSVGNVYRYYRGKEELFAEAVPDAFVATLTTFTEKRVRTFGGARHVDEHPPGSPYDVISRELLAFAIANRQRVVILLSRAEGTPHAAFVETLVARLVELAIAWARNVFPSIRVGAPLRFAVGSAYENFVSALCRALVLVPSDRAVEATVNHLTDYHLGGLANLFESASVRRSEAP